MEQKAQSPYTPPYIAMRNRNKRILNRNNVASTFQSCLKKDLQVSLYEKIPGTYEITFELEDDFK